MRNKTFNNNDSIILSESVIENEIITCTTIATTTTTITITITYYNYY